MGNNAAEGRYNGDLAVFRPPQGQVQRAVFIGYQRLKTRLLRGDLRNDLR